MQTQEQKFYIIGHNAADTQKTIKPWKNSDVSHLEIDVQQTRSGFKAMHSLIKGLLPFFRLWPFVVPLDKMIAAVITEDKNIYIDFKRGDVEALYRYLQKRQILPRCSFVIYGRERAELLKRLAPDNDVFLHVRGNDVRIFDDRPNIYHIGVCLAPKQLVDANVSYMRQHHARILATFVNNFEDALHALTLDLAGITTDIPQLATMLDTKWQQKQQQRQLAKRQKDSFTNRSNPDGVQPA